MKIKLLTLTAIVTGFLAIGSANAADDPVWQAEATCEGGSLATGENGHEYCQSNSKMNWWSAYTWCEAQGRHLVSIYEICPGWSGSTGTNGQCPNHNPNSFLKGGHWTSTVYQENQALYVYYSYVFPISRNSNNYYALCYQVACDQTSGAHNQKNHPLCPDKKTPLLDKQRSFFCVKLYQN